MAFTSAKRLDAEREVVERGRRAFAAHRHEGELVMVAADLGEEGDLETRMARVERAPVAHLEAEDSR